MSSSFKAISSMSMCFMKLVEGCSLDSSCPLFGPLLRLISDKKSFGIILCSLNRAVLLFAAASCHLEISHTKELVHSWLVESLYCRNHSREIEKLSRRRLFERLSTEFISSRLQEGNDYLPRWPCRSSFEQGKH